MNLLIEKLVKKLEQKNIYYVLFMISMILIGMCIYVYPMVLDDYIYSLNWVTGEEIHSFNDIMSGMIAHYMQWGGRFTLHTILQILFWIGKPLCIIPILFAFYMLLRCVLRIANIDTKDNTYLVLLCISIFYFLNPNFKETFLWMTGIANYLFGTLFIFLYLVLYTDVLFHKRSHSSVLLLILGILAGWTNENMSISLVIMTIVILIYHKRKHMKIDSSLYFGFVGNCIGAGLLILAPGNFVRASEFSGLFQFVMYRGYGQMNAWFHWLFPIFLCLGLSYYVLYRFHKKMSEFDYFYLLFALLSVITMLAAPVYPSRATFGTFTICTMLFMKNVAEISKQNEHENKMIKITSYLIWIACVMCLIIVFAEYLVKMLGIEIVAM